MIYGYVRASTDKQSTENQRFEIEKFAKAKSMRIDRWVEETISGTIHYKYEYNNLNQWHIEW